MQAANETNHLQKRNRIAVQIDGVSIEGCEGQTVAAVLAANGIRLLRRTSKSGAPRGVFCGIGICYECLVTINGVPHQRACATLITAGMSINTGMVK